MPPPAWSGKGTAGRAAPALTTRLRQHLSRSCRAYAAGHSRMAVTSAARRCSRFAGRADRERPSGQRTSADPLSRRRRPEPGDPEPRLGAACPVHPLHDNGSRWADDAAGDAPISRCSSELRRLGDESGVAAPAHFRVRGQPVTRWERCAGIARVRYRPCVAPEPSSLPAGSAGDETPDRAINPRGRRTERYTLSTGQARTPSEPSSRC